MSFLEKFKELKDHSASDFEMAIFLTRLDYSSKFDIKVMLNIFCKIIKCFDDVDFYPCIANRVYFPTRSGLRVKMCNLLISQKIINLRKRGYRFVFENNKYNSFDDEYNIFIVDLKSDCIFVNIDESYMWAHPTLFYDSIREKDGIKLIFLLRHFSNYPYIKEFVDELIDYRFKNGIKNITNEEVEKFAYEFVVRKLDKKRLNEKKDILLRQRTLNGPSIN